MSLTSAFAAARIARRLPTFLPSPTAFPRACSRAHIAHLSSDSTAKKHLRNAEIKLSTVQLVNPETGRLDPPAPFRRIFASIDPLKQFVELVQEDPPIVRIGDKQKEYADRKARKAIAKKQRKNELKEVQMTWGVGEADLEHKLKKVRLQLDRGNRVDLVIAPKSKQSLPCASDMDTMVTQILEKLSDVAHESHARTFKRNVAVLHLCTSEH